MEIKRYPEFSVEPPPASQDEGEDDFRLAPVESKSHEELGAELDNRRDYKLPLSDGERAELERLLNRRKRGKFTLLEAFALLTVACAGLSLSTYLPVHIFAGALGFIVLVVLYLLPRMATESRLFWIALWTTAIIYLSAAMVALFGG